MFTREMNPIQPRDKQARGKLFWLSVATLGVLLALAAAGFVKGAVVNLLADDTPAPNVTDITGGPSGIPDISGPISGADTTPAPPCTPDPGGDPDAPLTEAPVTVWSRDGGTSRPSSPTIGPAVLTPYAYCYSHTAAGALFAAANYAAQMTGNGMTPGKEIDLAVTAAANDPGRAAIIGKYQALTTVELAPASGDFNVPPVQFLGYRYITYSSTAAEVELLDSWNEGLSAVTYSLRWESGDWKLVLPGSGDFPSRRVAPPVPAEFTRWTGQAPS